jgi:hypothetical protein
MGFKLKWTRVQYFFRKTYRLLFLNMNKEFYVFLLFLGLSILFWFLQSTQATSQTELSIPLRYGKLPENITVTNELPDCIKVAVRDKGSHLYNYHIHRRKLGLELDLLRWRADDGIGRISLEQFKPIIFAKLKPSAQILRISPDSLILYFVEKEQKDLPVKLNAQVALSRQYMLVEEPSIQPAFVRAYAPSSILDSLELVETEFLDLPVLRDSVSMDVKLKAIEGVHFDQTSVRVHFPVEEFTEVRYEIPVTGLDFPENLLLRSFPSKVVVSFLVSKSNYQSVKAEDFQLGISYRDLIESNEDLQSVKLIKTPDYVQRLSLHPDKVECLIEKK